MDAKFVCQTVEVALTPVERGLLVMVGILGGPHIRAGCKCDFFTQNICVRGAEIRTGDL
jgi:hypothetical protein